MDQRELVDRAAQGDHDAFAVLVRGSIARLDAAARLILRDPELARDAVQESLVGPGRAFPGCATRIGSTPGSTGSSSIPASIFSVTGGGVSSRSSSTRSMPPFVGDVSLTVADRDELDRALQRLDPEWRAVVVVHYFLGLPLPDVAAVLGIPVGTAKSRLHRSLAAMRLTFDAEATPETAELPRGQLA